MLLDRDGVLNEDIGRPGVISVDQLRMEEGASQAVKIFREAGFRVSVVTNQNSISKGILKESDMADIHQRMLTELPASPVDDLYVSTGISGSGGFRLKPAADMMEAALQQGGIDKSSTVSPWRGKRG